MASEIKYLLYCILNNMVSGHNELLHINPASIPASRTNVTCCQAWQISYQNLDRDMYIKYGFPLWMLTIMYQFYYKMVVGIIIKISNNDFLSSNKFE